MELRDLLAEYQVSRDRAPSGFGNGRSTPEWLLSGLQSVEVIAFRLCEVVHGITGRTAAVVMRDPITQIAYVAAVSAGTDRRLLGLTVPPTSPAGRACMGAVRTVGMEGDDLFGRPPENRRRRERQGTAFPLRNKREGVGALVLFGPHKTLAATAKEKVDRLAQEAGPLLGQAAAIRSSEKWAMTDEVTGAHNRRSLEIEMHGRANEPCSLMCVDVDQFNEISDLFGRVIAASVLRHVAAVFRHGLRDYDVPARIGEEEFALLLPDTAMSDALLVAERLRTSLSESPFRWKEGERMLTCSIGVASIPETVSEVDNLISAADSALYQARKHGRNRVSAALRKLH